MRDRQDLVLARLKAIQAADQLTVGQVEELAAPRGAFATSSSSGITVGPDDVEVLDRALRNQTLSPSEIRRLESIINSGLRPALDVANDSYDALPSMWQLLNERRTSMESLIRGIGRVQVAGHPRFAQLGTAFVCGPRVLMTCRHVAEVFIDGVGQQIAFKPGLTTSIDLKQEVASPAAEVLTVTAPVLILDAWDIALVQVDRLPDAAAPLPLARVRPEPLENRMVATIGYPGFNPFEDVMEQIRVFRGVFDKKRLQPGRLKGLKPTASYGKSVEVVTHDCSTLTGNSGSAVIDVETGRVVGVHFKGAPLIENYATPTWQLALDARVVDLGVKFE